MAIITAGDILETIVYIVKLWSTGLVLILFQLGLFCFHTVRWISLCLFYVISTLLEWLSTSISITLHLIGMGAKNASKMNESSKINAVRPNAEPLQRTTNKSTGRHYRHHQRYSLAYPDPRPQKLPY